MSKTVSTVSCTNSILELELDSILQISRENILVTDGNGYVLRANPHCDTIYGTDPGYFIGKTVYQLEQEGVFRPSVTALVLKRRCKAQIMQKTRTGRIVLATGVPVFDLDGQLLRVVSSSYDLTEIQLLREEYERLQIKMLGSHSVDAPIYRPRAVTTSELVFRSVLMHDVVELIQRIAQADVTVLLLGETGVGKTALARFLHSNSQRSNGRFVALNCSTIPESLFEAQMFGYEAGSFTGADRNGKIGLIELADKGTLFLDEIGDLPVAMQAKLLTVLEDRSLLRLGGTIERRVDFRVVASSNRDLKDLVDKGEFRPDLYYRLSVFPITVPPLRLRTDDVAELVDYFLRRLNTQFHRGKSLTQDSLLQLLEYSWPGNIRELKNVLERLWLSSPTDLITINPGDLYRVPPSTSITPNAKQPFHPAETLKQAIERLEYGLLKEARLHCKTTYEIAESLGISQPSVVRRLKKYGIES